MARRRTFFRTLVLILKLKLKKIPFPLYPQISFLEYLSRTYDLFSKSSLDLYAAAISLHFFMSIFPFFLFLLTLVAYLPFLRSYEPVIIEFFQTNLPLEMQKSVILPLKALYREKRFDLLSLSTIIMLYHSSSAFHTLIKAIHLIHPSVKMKLSFWQEWRNAFLLLLLFLLLFLFFFLTAGFSTFFYDHWLNWMPHFPFSVLKNLLFLLLFFGIFLLLYYFAVPKNVVRIKFLGIGALIAAILFLLSSTVLSYYFAHFSSYNKLYGSFGALLITVFWFYLFGYITLIGYVSFAIFTESPE